MPGQVVKKHREDPQREADALSLQVLAGRSFHEYDADADADAREDTELAPSTVRPVSRPLPHHLEPISNEASKGTPKRHPQKAPRGWCHLGVVYHPYLCDSSIKIAHSCKARFDEGESEAYRRVTPFEITTENPPQ